MTRAAAIAQSGLAAATLRLAASASNLANTPRAARLSAAPGGGVSAQSVTAKTARLLVYDPASPVVGVGGMVQTPEIDPVAEVTNQIAAGRAFAFSLEALKAADDEQKRLLDIKT